MKNFKNSTLTEVQVKIKELIDLAGEEMGTLFPNSEMCGCLNVNEIEGNYKSGWIPHQDGGFKVSDFCLNGDDPSHHETEGQTESANEQAKSCYEAFKSDFDIETEEIPENMLEEFYEYEGEWEEPALVEFQAYIDGGRVRVERYINYKDAPYYREKYGETISAIGYNTKEFMSLSNEDIIKELTA